MTNRKLLLALVAGGLFICLLFVDRLALDRTQIWPDILWRWLTGISLISMYVT